jgi:hypothetical protein
MLAAGLACATAGAGWDAGLAAAVLCRAGLLEAQPINGTDKKLAAVRPRPCCIKSLRDAIAHPFKTMWIL